mmetsp:Transcript_10574/g.33670  ORF Transcript_10574/g.33670 Transcript_10574/m.33670 type:complete len:284 (-) Transcript_10574:61-912(-)
MHKHGVYHGDLKPANVLVAEDGTFLITDFGMARTMSTVSAIVSKGGASKLIRSAPRVKSGGTEEVKAGEEEGADPMGGTWPYMAPEQFQSPKPRASADVYSLAVLLYEALDCCQPKLYMTEAHAIQVIVKEGLERDTLDLEEAATGAGLPGLVPLLKRGWARDRRERPNAAEMYAELAGMVGTVREGAVNKAPPAAAAASAGGVGATRGDDGVAAGEAGCGVSLEEFLGSNKLSKFSTKLDEACVMTVEDLAELAADEEMMAEVGITGVPLRMMRRRLNELGL